VLCPSCGASETPPPGVASKKRENATERPTLRASSCRKEPGND
jgi:hypothetical protein